MPYRKNCGENNLLPSSVISALPLPVDSVRPVSGGDINQSFCLLSEGKKYFLKMNRAEACPGMLLREAQGLQSLREKCNLKIPEVRAGGEAGGMQYLLLEWLESGDKKPESFFRFGVELALLHQQPANYFGWEADNYIGSLPQRNSPMEKWGPFYAEYRLRPLVQQLLVAGSFHREQLRDTDLLADKLDRLFPAEPPALLHGDLWNGNYLITPDGSVALFDPAVYNGHREMDLGMTALFGGFAPEFYEGYQSVCPLEPGWQERISLTWLYPLLVHARLFGGSYVARAAGLLREWATT